MVKNSFTLLESIISVFLLALIITGIFNSSYYDNKANENFMLLNKIENDFTSNKYKNYSIENKTLNIIINEKEEKTINVKQYKYENKNIKVVRYEK